MDKDKILEMLDSLEKGACVVVTFYDDEFVIRYEGLENGNLILRNGVWCKSLGYRAGRNVLCRLESVQNIRYATCEEEKMLHSHIKDWHEGEFSFFNEGDILFVKSDEFEYVIRYDGVDENGLVIRGYVLTKDLEYRSGRSALCYLGEVSAVREASFAEIAMLLQCMAKEK